MDKFGTSPKLNEIYVPQILSNRFLMSGNFTFIYAINQHKTDILNFTVYYTSAYFGFTLTVLTIILFLCVFM